MIPVANNLEEAINHFMKSDGMLGCHKKEGSRHCKTLKEANDFFNSVVEKPKKIRYKVRPIK